MSPVNENLNTLPKQVKVVVIFPCRLAPADQYTAKECKYGEKITLQKDDAIEAIGHKRVVLESVYNPKDYPEPETKKIAKGEKTGTAKPADK